MFVKRPAIYLTLNPRNNIAQPVNISHPMSANRVISNNSTTLNPSNNIPQSVNNSHPMSATQVTSNNTPNSSNTSSHPSSNGVTL